MAWNWQPVKQEQDAAGNWNWQPARVAEQTVLDDDTGQVYRAPVTFDEQDIRFAIATQVNKEPKRDFIGKVRYAAGEAWNWAEKFSDRVESGFQSAERGIVGLAGQALDTFLHASLSVPARVEQIEKYKNGDFSDWDASLNGRVMDEDIAGETDPALKAAMQFRKDRQDALIARAEERLEQRQRIRRKLDASIRKWQEVLRPEAEMNNYDRFMEAMGSGTASLALSVATLAATKNPQVAAGVMAGIFGRMRYTDVFDKSVEKGLDYATADDYATIAGTIEGGIELALEPFLYGAANLRPIRKITDEMIGGAVAKLNATAAGKSAARKIISKHRQSVGKQSLKAAAIEGSEEALQEAGGAYFENYTGLENTPQEEIMARTLLSFAVGGLTGAGAAVMGTSAYNREAAATNERIKQSLTQAYPELTTEEKQKTADALQEIFYQDGEGQMLDELEQLADKENDPDTLESGKHEISEDMRSILKKRYQMSDEEIDRTAEVAVASIDLRNQFNEAQTAFYDELVNADVKPNVAEPFSRLMAARASAVAMNEKKTVKDVLERWNLKFERKTRSIDYNTLLDDEILFQSEVYDSDGRADINVPEFKAWFGNSKVVDENGRPKTYWHGSLWNFDRFKQHNGDYNFSPDERFAYNYAESKAFEQGIDNDVTVYPVYIKAEKPFDSNNAEDIDFVKKITEGKKIRVFGNEKTQEKFIDEIQGYYQDTPLREGEFEKITQDDFPKWYSKYNHNIDYSQSSVAEYKVLEVNEKDGYFIAAKPPFRADMEDVESEIREKMKDVDFSKGETNISVSYETPYGTRVGDAYVMKVYKPSPEHRKKGADNWIYLESADIDGVDFTDILKENGYDGYYKVEDGIENLSVFEPNQIKSVYNRGTWDAGNDNIYYQGGERQNDLIKRTDKGKYLTDDEVLAVDKDAKDFAIKIAALEKGELPKREQLIVLNRLPSAYNDIKELKGKKLLITQDVYKKIIDIPNKFNKNHSVARNRAVKLPELAADPNYILQSKAKDHENRFVIVTKSRGKRPGERLSIIVQPGQNAAVVSGYDENINISEEKKAGRVLFDKKKELETKSTTLNVVDDSNSYTSNIASKEENVNNSLRQGAPEDARGAYDAAKRLITLFEGADPSTLVHEAAHFFLDDMRRFADNETTAAELQAIYRYVGSADGVLTTEQNEYFARSFEAYLMEGKAPNSLLGRVFEKFRKWLRTIYSQIKNLNVKLDDNIRKTFDEMLDGRKLDFAMQISRERLAGDIKAGNIGQTVINKALRLLEEGKMSKADMEEMIGRLEDGRLKRSDVKKYLEPFAQSTNRHHEAVYEQDYQRYRRRLEKGNVTPAAVRKKIDRLLEWTKPRTQNGKVVGRFPDIKVNRFFDAVRENINLKRDKALAKIDANLQRLDEITQKGMSGEDGNFRNVSDIIWENKVLAIPAGRASVGLMADVYNDIAEIYNTGRLSERVTGMVKRAWRERLIGEAVAVLDQGQGTNWRRESSDLAKRMRRFGLSMFSWNGIRVYNLRKKYEQELAEMYLIIENMDDDLRQMLIAKKD